MDVKKSKEADLESKRTTGFLLGMILVLSVFFVALEYTDGGDSVVDVEDNMLNDLPREEEDLIPLVTRKDLLTPMPKSQVRVPEQLRVVDDAADFKHPDEPGTEAGEEDMLPESNEQDKIESDVEEPAPPIINAENDPLNFRVVESLPEFPGGATEFIKWLTANLQYPKEARQRRIQGRVVAQFIVNTDGSISDLKIATSLDPLCDREALRVLKMMPPWKAGIQDNKPCRTMVALPIVFKL